MRERLGKSQGILISCVSGNPVNTFCLFQNKERQHTDFITMGLAALFFILTFSDAALWSCFFNSLNKMTNAAHENAMRWGPRN